jgi:drug/metabolite transporter (DMT)-like permease
MSKTRANLLLLLAAAFWGLGNVAQKTVREHLDPLSAVGLRCLIGGLIVLPLVASERRPDIGRSYCTSLVRVSVLFAVSIAIQQFAYQGTSVTNASFLVNTATAMTPLAAWLLLGERAIAVIWLAAGATLIGALLMSGGLSASVSLGDLAAFVSAASYALWMVELGRHMQLHGNPVTAATAQFLGTAALSLPLGLALGHPSLGAAIDAGPELLILGVFSTAAAFGIVTVCQRFTSASHAAVIVSAESVFGAAGGAMFLGERLSAAGLAGAAIMLGAIVFLASFARDAGAATPV